MTSGAAGTRRDSIAVAALDVLVVVVGDLKLGLPAAAISRVVPFAGVARVPAQPPTLLGVVQNEGDVTAVVDLRPRLGAVPGAGPERGHLVFLREAGSTLGLAVDGLGGVVTLDPDDRIAMPGNADTARAALTLAWYRCPEGFIEVLDPAILCEIGTSP